MRYLTKLSVVPVILVASVLLADTSKDGILSLIVKQLSQAPLPYQAIRFKASLENHSARPLRRLMSLEAQLSVRRIKSPDDASPRFILAGPFHPISLDTAPKGIDRLPGYQRLSLGPDEKETLTFQIAEHRESRGTALFSRPGTYQVNVQYGGAPNDPPRFIEADPFRVIVRKPEGVDASVHELIVHHPALAELFLFPLVYMSELPDMGTVNLMEKIVARYSESSYADYARFALARIYLIENGADKAPSATQKRDAITQLEKINFKEFPHGPSALILLMKISEPEKAERIKARLDMEFADAFEWLAEQAENITHEEWLEMKAKAPIVRGPRQPKK